VDGYQRFEGIYCCNLQDRFEVLTVVNIITAVLWDVFPRYILRLPEFETENLIGSSFIILMV
jgi:hypothetical protein